MKLPVILLAALAAAPAVYSATFLSANISGTFPAETTLGGVALGTETPFSMAATFDASANKNTFGSGISDFDIISLSLTIPGQGSFTGTAGQQPLLLFTDYDTTMWWGVPSVIISSPFTLGGFSFLSSTTTHSFSATAPAPVVFGAIDNIGSNGAPGLIKLDGVLGGLEIQAGHDDLRGLNPSVSITAAAVPEPGEYAAAFGLGLAGFAAWRRRSRKVASVTAQAA